MPECNYSVKYALLPIKEFKINKMGNEYSVIACYIVAKAYVVEEYKKNNPDGTTSMTYKIVFPHIVYTDRVNHFRKTPDSPLARDNEMVTSKLYDSLEDAKAYREERNLLVPSATLEKYLPLEEEVLALAEDLEVTQDAKIMETSKEEVMKKTHN